MEKKANSGGGSIVFVILITIAVAAIYIKARQDQLKKENQEKEMTIESLKEIIVTW
mgnify:CR=1 FL=1